MEAVTPQQAMEKARREEYERTAGSRLQKIENKKSKYYEELFH